jgi:hypothetical protein
MIHWLKRLFTDKDGDADEMAVLVVAGCRRDALLRAV